MPDVGRRECLRRAVFWKSKRTKSAGMVNSITADTPLSRRKRCIMNVAEAEKNFTKLVDKVYLEGVSVDLERDDK